MDSRARSPVQSVAARSDLRPQLDVGPDTVDGGAVIEGAHLEGVDAPSGVPAARASVIGLMRSAGLATVLPLALSVVSAPLLARAMDPGDRGRVGGILAATTVVTAIALGGVAQQLPQDLARARHHVVWRLTLAAGRRLMPGAVVVAALLAALTHFVWPGSLYRTGLVVSIVLSSWALGVGRAAFAGVGDHARASGTYLNESLARFSGIVLLVAVWGTAGPTLALLMTGAVPPLIAIVVASRRFSVFRRSSAEPATSTTPRTRRSGYTAVSMSLSQQFMGRSVLSVWALTLPAESVGYFVIAFALTEMTVNFARIGQPLVIHDAESGRPRVLPWLIAIVIASAISMIGGLVVLEPLFGSEYAPAVRLVAPLAVAQGMFGIVVVTSGARFVSDRAGSIRSMRRWQAATVLATVALAMTSTDFAVAVTFAVMAAGQAAMSLRAIRPRQSDAASAA